MVLQSKTRSVAAKPRKDGAHAAIPGTAGRPAAPRRAAAGLPASGGERRAALADERAAARLPVAGAAPEVRHLVVGAEQSGQRLDNFLLRLAKGVPKSHVYRIVRSGEVRVNGGRSSAEYRLETGDELRIPPMRLAASPEGLPPAPAQLPAIVFEDEHLMVLDKPSGVAAHGGSGVAHGVIERARAARPNQPFLELGHRLDRETSGLLMLAKTRRCLVALHEQMRAGEVCKRYLALVIGAWVNDRQHVRLALTKRVTGSGERRVFVDAQDGAPSHTIITLRARLQGYSLLEAELKTGRTHQIRVHLAHLGFPIVGDDKYGDFAHNRQAARAEQGARLGRMFLHAYRLELAHPVGGAPLTLESPLPSDCVQWLDAHLGAALGRR